MSVEEMAEMAYCLLVNLGFSSTRDWFNGRLFLTPNNEAFFAIFQFLLKFKDPQMFREKFKLCLPLSDKRREGDFRRILCSYLQELAAHGDLGNDVPVIKMALFTTPGRRAFLEMLLAVIEWVLRKKSSVLGIVVPPEDASEEALQSVLQFYKNQGEADAKVAEQVVCDMQTQVELLVSDLQRTEAAVQASRQELTKAQEQTKTTEEDEKNLQKLSSALSAIATMSGPLQRLLEIVQSDSPSRDALAIAEPLPEVLVQIVPEDTLTTDELNERISLGKVDILRHLTLISAILRNRRPLYNEVVEKLSVGSAIDRTLSDQRSCLQRAKDALDQIGELKKIKTKSMTNNVIDELEADEDALILAIDPPSIPELEELANLSEASLDFVGEISKVSSRAEQPTRAKLERKKIGISNMPVTDVTSVFTPTIDKLKSGHGKRRSIKEVFTSTPLVKPQ